MDESIEIGKARAEIKALNEAIAALSYRYAEEVASNAVDCAHASTNACVNFENAAFADTWRSVLDGLTPRDVENAVKLARSEMVFEELTYWTRIYGEYIGKDGGNGGIDEYADELTKNADVFCGYGIDRDWFMEFNADRIRERYERERDEYEAAEMKGGEDD